MGCNFKMFDLDAYFEENPTGAEDLTDVPLGFKSGFVTFVGRPNSGKSTLLNSLVGQKVAITSKVANTTRHRFSGVINREDCQIVLCDTPGIHKPKDVMGEELNLAATQAIVDTDIVCFLLDATSPFGRGDEWVLNSIKDVDAIKFCLITKTDIASEEQILSQISSVSNHFPFDEVIPLSALKKQNLETFIALAKDNLQEGHRWFATDEVSDVDEFVFVSEIIREKLLSDLKDEIPHSIGVVTEEIYSSNKGRTTNIISTIYVEKDSQVGIVIGKGGNQLKRVGTKARAELEQYFNNKVNLQLGVKLKKNWRRDENAIKRFGYCQ